MSLQCHTEEGGAITEASASAIKTEGYGYCDGSSKRHGKGLLDLADDEDAVEGADAV